MIFQRPDDENTIEDPKQIMALCSPVRNAIHKVVLSQGEVSIREIANQLGRKPASLYRHIDHLVEVGLLVESGTQHTSRREAKTYTCDLAYFRYRNRTPEMVEAIAAYARASLKEAGKSLTRTFSKGDAVLRVPHRDTMIANPSGWLSPDEIAQLNEHIDAIFALMQDKPRKPDTKRITVTMGMRPTEAN